MSSFILHLVEKGWRNLMLWTFRGAILFAIAAVLSDIIQAMPGSAMKVNNAPVSGVFGLLALVDTL
jgi:hypothetical protein